MTGPMAFRISELLRDATPAALTAVLVLIEVTPIGIPGLPPVAPSLAMIGVFHWAAFRPEIMPAWLALLIGVLHDLASGAPLGLTGLVFILLQGVCASQRRWFLTTSFPIAWMLFALIAFGAGLVGWLLACFYALQLLDLVPVLMRAAITVAFYPPLSWLLGRVEQRLWAFG
jgi:rod shape-determining protein MreD